MKQRIFLRVSRTDLDEQTQLPVILQTFGLNEKNVKIHTEQISAYIDEKQAERSEFINLKSDIENGLVSEVYVYSLERFERNLKRMLLFYFFCESHDTRLYSALQPYLNNMFPQAIDKALAKNPIYQFIKYLMVLIYGFLAENESWFTSQRTKKAYIEGYSYKGNKWGKKFRGTPDNLRNNEKGKVDLSKDEIDKLIRFIQRHGQEPYDLIKKKVRDKFGLELSNGYIHKAKSHDS